MLSFRRFGMLSQQIHRLCRYIVEGKTSGRRPGGGIGIQTMRYRKSNRHMDMVNGQVESEFSVQGEYNGELKIFSFEPTSLTRSFVVRRLI